MIVAFHANAVTTEHPDGDCLLVGFADELHATDRYLLLQRAFAHDDQDIALGQDTYHVELCDQGQSGYGGIARCVLHRDRLEVFFTPEVQIELDGVEGASITFRIGDEEYSILQRQLSDVFRGNDCFTMIEA
jgi:hypothetical protein